MQSESDEPQLTDGKLLPVMMRLAWPMVVLQLLQVAYNIADTAFLGAWSADAVGALSLSFPLIFLMISVGGGFTEAGSILVAQYRGAQSSDRVNVIAGQTLGFITIVSCALGALGFLATGPLLSALPASPETSARLVPLAANYMRIYSLGLPFLFGFFLFVSLLRGYGNTRTPMRVMVVSVVVNVVLDPVLIFGFGPVPPLGVEGAAIATITARAVATVIGFYILIATDVGPAFHIGHLRPQYRHVLDIVRLGIPSAVEQSLSSFAFVILTGMVVVFPPEVVAAYGLGDRVISLALLPSIGLAQAISTIVGQNLGADRADRAVRASRFAIGITTVVMGVLSVIGYVFAKQIVGAFLTTDTANAAVTAAYGVDYLHIAVFMFAFMGVLQIVLGTFRGAGNTKTALAISLVTLWGVRVPLTYLLIFVIQWNTTGIWVSVLMGDVIGSILGVAWYLRGTWTERYITAGPDTCSNGSAVSANND